MHPAFKRVEESRDLFVKLRVTGIQDPITVRASPSSDDVNRYLEGSSDRRRVLSVVPPNRPRSICETSDRETPVSNARSSWRHPRSIRIARKSAPSFT
jgi:hypothetical protein